MKLILFFAAVHAALAEPASHRLRAQHMPVHGLSLLQEEPSADANKNSTVVAAKPDQIDVADEKVVPVTTMATFTNATNKVEKVITDAQEDSEADSEEDAKADAEEDAKEDAADAAEAKAEEADAKEDAGDKAEGADTADDAEGADQADDDTEEADEEADADADEEQTANQTVAAPKPVFDVEAIEHSLLNFRKTEGKASPGMMKFVKKVKVMITDMEAKIVDAHRSDQKLLYSYRAQFKKCRKGRTTAQSAIVSLRKQKRSSSSRHRSCRYFELKAFKVRDAAEDLLVAKKETQKAACGSLRDLMRNPHSEANNCHASRTEKFPIWLRRNEAWFRFKNHEYKAAQKKCYLARSATSRQAKIVRRKKSLHMRQKARCDVYQGSLEDKSCGLGKKMSQTCHKYRNCYMDTRRAYYSAKPGIRNMESDRKGEWRVLKRVNCLLDVFAKDDGEVDAKVIDKCKVKTHKTTHLNLYYPPVPPKLKCPVLPAVPGQNKFIQSFYASLPQDAGAIASTTCIVEAGGGIVMGRPKGTTVDKCVVTGSGWLEARNKGVCKISDDRRRPIKVNYKGNKYTTYKFNMMFKGSPKNKNQVPFGGFRFCGGRYSKELNFNDSPNNARWGWQTKEILNPRPWAYYTNKNARDTGLVRGKPGKAVPKGGKVMRMEVTVQWMGSWLRLYSWKVNGVLLRKYHGHRLCWSSSTNQMVPMIHAKGPSKGILIRDFKVYQGSNAVMAMPQIIGDGVPRTLFTVRCSSRNKAVSGQQMRVSRFANALACQQQCQMWSGCIRFSFGSDGMCRLYKSVTKYYYRKGIQNGPAACERPYTTGLKVEFFKFSHAIHRMPNLAFRKPDQTRTDLVVNYPSTGAFWPGVRYNERFVARWTGAIFIKNAGRYIFHISSGDGSFLFLDGQKVLNNGGLHGMRGRNLVTTMKSGYTPLVMTMFENGGGAGMQFKYYGPDTMNQWAIVPTDVLRPTSKSSKKKVGPFGTPDDKKYKKFPGQSKLIRSGSKVYVLFTVRAKNDAHVTLYSTPIGKNPATRPAGSYEIVIGGWGNGRSAIRKGGTNRNAVFPYTKGIVSKDEYRKFYIVADLKKKTVTVGKGHNINKYGFMKFRDPSMKAPKSFAVMTGWGGTGEWLFHNRAYGLQFVRARRQKFGQTAWFLGDTGKDCDDTCSKQGRTCDSNIRQGYSYSKFREFIAANMGASCVKDNRAWWGQDQPCYVSNGPDGNQGKCLASRNIPMRVKCSGKHPKVMRWCKCSATKMILQTLSVGKKKYSDMFKLAKRKGGRLMTLAEAKLALHRRGNRPLRPGKDAWAAVTNPESTCRIGTLKNIDWIQVGNRGHWTGKSHFQYHKCPNWSEWVRRPHWDSGYLMLAKTRR